MLKLNFPDCDIKVKLKQNKPHVFDVVRKKWIRLTHEEWVRTHCIQFLNLQKNFPLSLLRIEQQFNVFDRQKRFDLIACNSKQEPLVLVECKSPEVKIRQNTFDQLSRYNLVLKSPYSMITNGLNHYFYTVNFDNQSFKFIKELPNYNELK